MEVKGHFVHTLFLLASLYLLVGESAVEPRASHKIGRGRGSKDGRVGVAYGSWGTVLLNKDHPATVQRRAHPVKTNQPLRTIGGGREERGEKVKGRSHRPNPQVAQELEWKGWRGKREVVGERDYDPPTDYYPDDGSDDDEEGVEEEGGIWGRNPDDWRTPDPAGYWDRKKEWLDFLAKDKEYRKRRDEEAKKNEGLIITSLPCNPSICP